MENLLEEIKELIRLYPNDMDLGAEIRKIIKNK